MEIFNADLAFCATEKTVPVLRMVSISMPLEAQSLEIFYPPPESRQDTRDEDVAALLRMALEKTVETDGQFTLKPSYQIV